MSEKTEKTPETIEFRRTPVNGLVSVIIPVRDGAQHLADAINSALAQTYRRVEVIVVDNGSKDASPTIARRFEPHVRLIQEHRPGAHHARNRGLAESQGEYIQFLDHDDLLDADEDGARDGNSYLHHLDVPAVARRRDEVAAEARAAVQPIGDPARHLTALVDRVAHRDR